MVKSKIYVVKYAPVSGNSEKRQAFDIGKQLLNVAFDYVLTSPFDWAIESCEIILKPNRYGGSCLADQRLAEPADQKQIFTFLDELKLKVKDTDARILIVVNKNASPIIQAYFQNKHQSSNTNISVYEFDYSK